MADTASGLIGPRAKRAGNAAPLSASTAQGQERRATVPFAVRSLSPSTPSLRPLPARRRQFVAVCSAHRSPRSLQSFQSLLRAFPGTHPVRLPHAPLRLPLFVLHPGQLTAAAHSLQLSRTHNTNTPSAAGRTHDYNHSCSRPRERPCRPRNTPSIERLRSQHPRRIMRSALA